MLLDEHYSDQGDAGERDRAGHSVTVEERGGLGSLEDTDSEFQLGSPAEARAGNGNPLMEIEPQVETASVLSGNNKTRKLGTRWWILAAGSALLLTILTLAAVYLLTKKPSTVDQIIILT